MTVFQSWPYFSPGKTAYDTDRGSCCCTNSSFTQALKPVLFMYWQRKDAVIRENWLLKAVASLSARVKNARIDIPYALKYKLSVKRQFAIGVGFHCLSVWWFVLVFVSFSVLFRRKRKKISKENNVLRLRFRVLLTPVAIILQPHSRGQGGQLIH